MHITRKCLTGADPKVLFLFSVGTNLSFSSPPFSYPLWHLPSTTDVLNENLTSQVGFLSARVKVCLVLVLLKQWVETSLLQHKHEAQPDLSLDHHCVAICSSFCWANGHSEEISDKIVSVNYFLVVNLQTSGSMSLAYSLMFLGWW